MCRAVTDAYNVERCMPTMHSHKWWRIYNMYLTIGQYFIPLIIFNAIYGCVVYKVYIAQARVKTESLRKQFEERRKRVSIFVFLCSKKTLWPYEHVPDHLS